MNVYYRISDGSMVEESEALLGKTLRDGYGVRLALSFKDASGDERTVPVGYVLDGSMLISDSQDDYEARISSAWRGSDAKPKAKRPRIEKAVYTIGDLPASQTAYEKRLSDAWRAAA